MTVHRGSCLVEHVEQLRPVIALGVFHQQGMYTIRVCAVPLSDIPCAVTISGGLVETVVEDEVIMDLLDKIENMKTSPLYYVPLGHTLPHSKKEK